MDGKSKETMLILIVIFVVLIAALGGIGYIGYQIARDADKIVSEDEPIIDPDTPIIEEENETTTPTPTKRPEKNFGSYAFKVEDEGAYIDKKPNQSFNYNFNIAVFDNTDTSTDVDTGIEDEGLISDLMKQEAQNTQIKYGNLTRVQVPVISIDSPILQGANGDDLLDRGMWLHPASYTDSSGEKILYCHRRYFGRYDSRTCWNLNKVKRGHEVILYNKNGDKFTYKVISTSIVSADTTIMMRPSNKDYVKIITCGSRDGAPGGNDYRVVILAELQQ